jgi:hypothetical protein
MTELFVNNEQVVLPENFSTDIIEGNPFINPIGETSLDITVSLLEPGNAHIFGYLQRTNSNKDVAESLPCTLIVNTKEYHGLCIILEFSDEDVSIQLVFKNSIFAYAIDDDLMLRDLDLGTATIPSNIPAHFDLTYPDTDFQLLMLYDPDITYSEFGGGNQMVNGDLLNRLTYVYNTTTQRYELTYGHDGNPVKIYGIFALGDIGVRKQLYSIQPYLVAIIRRVIEALGFEIGENEILDTVYKYAIIVNNSTSLKYADTLPDWTVRKFIEQVQIWQNCRFIYNPFTAVVDIRYNHLSNENAELVELAILDDFTGVSEEVEPVMNRQRNIEYNLPNTDIYKFTDLGDLSSKFQNIETSASSLALLINHMKTVKNPHWIYLYEDAKLILREGDIPAFVDEYRMLKNNPDKKDADETLDIVPSEMALVKFYIRGRMETSTTSYIYLMVPVVRNSQIMDMNFDDEDSFISVEDAINDSSLVSEDIDTKDVMQIVLYRGYKQYTVRGTNVFFDGMPESYTRHVSDIYPDGGFHTIGPPDPRIQNPLSLQYLNENIYSKESEIDATKLYRFRFFAPLQDLDITDIFLINGEHYRAFQFNKKINIDGMEEVIEGEFFKLK